MIRWATELLLNYPEAIGVIGGLLFSWAATQRVKFMLPTTWSTAKFKSVTRTVATLTAFGFCYGLWEAIDHMRSDPSSERPLAIIISIGCALASPLIYTLTLKVVEHFFPWIDNIMSARPENPKS